MAEPTLVQIFGIGTTQDATTLTIPKSALSSTNLTASANNTAESLLTAIVMKAKEYLTPDNHDANLDQSLIITDGYLPTIVLRGTAKYSQDTFTIALEKPLGNTAINPNDY
ncbi:MAG: hypothetical protein V7L25_31015 [Nostoc sp.]|uniref:hypothetical protein n=1 Tax=Nostoc sp. TaxID=1180 RepID=UPI002FEED979